MEKNRLAKTILIAFLCLVMGSGLTYCIIKYYPGFTKTINTVKKEVTVNENGISDGIEAVYDAVVTIQNYQAGKLKGLGSGFIYDKTGLIMTNNHVISSATELKVILSDGTSIAATVIGSDEYADIAVIKIDEKYVTSVATLGSSEKSKLGDTVFAVGTPMSTEYRGTVTRGIISGKDRMVTVSSEGSSDWIMNVMQTDAAINPGNSGGPLCNVSGEVIGINNMKIVESSIEGIGFAIPIEDALTYANKIVNNEEIKRAYLGIQMTDISSVSSYSLRKEGISLSKNITSGVIVLSVLDNTPASEAKIEKGDVITRLENYKTDTVAELRYYLYKYNPGDKVELTLIRDGNERKVTVTLGSN